LLFGYLFNRRRRDWVVFEGAVLDSVAIGVGLVIDQDTAADDAATGVPI
jgi:hypothetical protein